MKYALPITIDFKKSIGAYIHDKNNNKKYLDFFNMYSSLSLGYNHPIFDDKFRNQINDISYIRMANNVCKSDELLDFIDVFKQYTFSDNYHFACTGALAVEAAIKTAMEYKKYKNPLVIGVKNSFHGINSWGFITDRVGVTEKRMEFLPQNNWINLELDEIIKYLQKKEMKSLIAIIIEPIQATNGDIYLDVDKLKSIKKLCEEKDICFIIDEIQTGFGTTGKMWYYEHMNITPDILIFGKKSQICGIIISDKYKEVIKSPYKKLAVTFDGELIDIVRATYILKAFKEFNILDKVIKNSQYIKKMLQNKFLNYRSIGYLIAFDFVTQAKRDNFIKLCFDNNLLINKAGDKTVRLRPNLSTTENEIEELIKIIYKVLSII